MKHFETCLQKQVIKYLELQYKDKLWCGTTAFIKLNAKQAMLNKRFGYRKGYPDLLIFEPSGKYIGLAIEFKSERGRQSKEQKWWQEQLEKRGWMYVVSRDFNKTISIIDNYFGVVK